MKRFIRKFKSFLSVVLLETPLGIIFSIIGVFALFTIFVANPSRAYDNWKQCASICEVRYGWHTKVRDNEMCECRELGTNDLFYVRIYDGLVLVPKE